MWTNDDVRKPDKGGWYLTVTKNGSVMALDFNMKHQAWNVSDNYTDSEINVQWWMPIPELPARREYDDSKDADLVYRAIGKEQGNDTTSAAVV